LDDSSNSDESVSPVPSGEWTGFYLEQHQPRRGWMHLYLSFREGNVQGEGADYVGPWSISGSYDIESGRVSWIKRYLGKHQVNYDGTITKQGIVGNWNIHHWNDGPFHIWPRSWFELENLYLKEDLSGQPPTILAGTVPVLPPNEM
jgi:hypothetical protein